MGKRTMTKNEWDYYKRGDIQFELTSSELKK
jgi:hypothetical protein